MRLPSRLAGVGSMSLIMCLVVLCRTAAAAPPAIVFDDQGLVAHSTLIPNDYNPFLPIPNVIRDDTFAGWVQSALTAPDPLNNNNLIPRVRDATFLFQQCFGGGFLDDVDRAISANNLGVPAPGAVQVKWVGGAASKHNQASFGQSPGAAVAPVVGDPIDRSLTDLPPQSYWTAKLHPQLLAANINADSIESARVNDAYGTMRGAAPNLEDGQLLYRNNGENTTLKDGAGTRYAILYAGYTDAQRHGTNIGNVYDKLRAAWGAAGKIYVVYGDGASIVRNSGANDIPAAWGATAAVQPGTALNLQNELAAIGAAITTNDQFLFYSSDHGGNDQVVGLGAGGGLIPGAGGGPGSTSPIQLSPSSRYGMSLEPNNVPRIGFEYLDPLSTAEVFINGSLIGQLTPGAGSLFQSFAVDETLLNAGDNYVTIQTLSGPSFSLTNVDFFTGAISDNIAAVPEPAVAGIAALACAAMTNRRRRTTSRRRSA